MTPAIFQASIVEHRGTFENWLANDSEHPLVVAADSTGEAIAFLFCMFQHDDVAAHKERAVVFDSMAALRKLSSSDAPFIPVVFIPVFGIAETENELKSVCRRRHCIVIRPANSIDPSPDIELRPLEHDAFEKALVDMGVDSDRTDRLARESGRSPTALRRRLSRKGGGQRFPDNAGSADMRKHIEQLEYIAKMFDVPLPAPPHLQHRVVGGYHADFYESGEELVDRINSCIQSAGKNLREFTRILDFGCGPGRVAVPMYYRLGDDTEIHATDLDGEAIAWCQENYATVARFQNNNAEPPFNYPDNYFDFVYSISVFTHLPEDLQLRWLAELQRITKPGGYLLLTIHGIYYRDVFESQPEGEEETFIYRDCGKTKGLPDFYRSTFHRHEYIMKNWSNFFEIMSIHECVIGNHQDAVLCRVQNVRTGYDQARADALLIHRLAKHFKAAIHNARTWLIAR